MLTEEEIAKYMETPEGALELQRILEDLRRSPPDISDIQEQDRLVGSEDFPLTKALGIGARGLDTPAEREFLRNPGAIGASPVNPGATRGLPPGISGINPAEENKRRMLQQLLQNQGMQYR